MIPACMKCLLFFVTFARYMLSSLRWSTLAHLAAGHAGDPPALTAQLWAPAGLRDGCSGRSKSRELASIRGIAFRRAT